MSEAVQLLSALARGDIVVSGVPVVVLLLAVGLLLLANSLLMLPPSEYVALSCGAVLAFEPTLGWWGVPLAVLIATASNFAGTYPWYLLGLRHSHTGTRLGVRTADIANPGIRRVVEIYTGSLDIVEAKYREHGVIVLIALRNIPVIRSICSYPAGIVRMPFLTFAWASALGMGIWFTLWIGLGFTTGLAIVAYKWPIGIGVGALSITMLRIVLGKMKAPMLNRK